MLTTLLVRVHPKVQSLITIFLKNLKTWRIEHELKWKKIKNDFPQKDRLLNYIWKLKKVQLFFYVKKDAQ